MAKMRLLIMQMHTQRIDLARVTNMAHKQLIIQIDAGRELVKKTHIDEIGIYIVTRTVS